MEQPPGHHAEREQDGEERDDLDRDDLPVRVLGRAQRLSDRDRTAVRHSLDQHAVVRTTADRTHRREPGTRVDERAVGRQHVAEVGWRLGTHGRPEHPHTLDGDATATYSSVKRSSGFVLGRDTDRCARLERADEDTERRCGPLELAVDLVDERAPNQARDDDTGDDEHGPDQNEGSDESMPQRHVSPVEARSRRRGPS